MPRDLLAGTSPAPRQPRDLLAGGGAQPAPAAAPQSNPIMDAVFRGNPVLGGLKAGFDALPDDIKAALGRDANRLGNSVADAVKLPMDTLTNAGGINDVQIDPNTGQPQPVSDQAIERSANAAGYMTPGELHPALLPGGGPRVVTDAGLPVPSKVISAVTRDQIPVADVAQRVQDLGPAATVADLGDNTQKLAAAVATQPGEAGAKITTQLKQRSKDSMTRVPNAINDTLGPATPPSEIHDQLKTQKKAVSPEYQQALAGAAPVDTSELAAKLDNSIVKLRGTSQDNARKIRDMLDQVVDPETKAEEQTAAVKEWVDSGAKKAGEPRPVWRPPLETDPEVLLSVRNAIDKMFKEDMSGGTKRDLTQTRDSIASLLDEVAPGLNAADAKYGDLSEQGKKLDAGANVLDAGKEAVWPQELDKTIAAATPGQKARLTQGARADIERIVGTKTNDRVALANIIQGESDWNYRKLASLFGQDKADAIMKVVQNERRLAETENLGINGSKTAAVTAAQQDLNGTPVQPSAARGRTLVDIILAGADKLTAGATAARREQTANDIARVIMGNGDWQRTAGAGALNVVQPLETALANGGGNRHDPLTEAVMRGGRP